MSLLNPVNRHWLAIDIYFSQVVSQIACFSVHQDSPFIKVTEKVSSDTEPRHRQTIESTIRFTTKGHRRRDHSSDYHEETKAGCSSRVQVDCLPEGDKAVVSVIILLEESINMTNYARCRCHLPRLWFEF